MTLDLADPALLHRASDRGWLHPERHWPALTQATAALPAPVVALSAEALAWNAQELLRRAGGLPIRVASKSVRSRGVLEAVLALPGFQGVLAYTLAEALWLSETITDVVVGYPSVDRAALASLANDERAAQRVTLMIDSVDHLDLIDAVVAPNRRSSVRICLDFDASLKSPVLGHVGVRRSPVRDPDALLRLALAVDSRPGFRLVGVMSYEAQIAGVADAPPGHPAKAALLRGVQHRSELELRERRAEAVAAVREVAELEFVNGGGTGSIERSVADASLTEVAAGSGLYGPHLFDHYRAFEVAPALAFALDVVRRPGPRIATLMGGGWIASGPPAPDRAPLPVWPAGLRTLPREGAGEVQTPVEGAAAARLAVGDRVWWRHAKAGEPLEHVQALAVVSGGRLGDPLPSYRGEGKCF